MDQEASMVSSRSRPICVDSHSSAIHRRQTRASRGSTKPLLSVFR